MPVAIVPPAPFRTCTYCSRAGRAPLQRLIETVVVRRTLVLLLLLLLPLQRREQRRARICRVDEIVQRRLAHARLPGTAEQLTEAKASELTSRAVLARGCDQRTAVRDEELRGRQPWDDRPVFLADQRVELWRAGADHHLDGRRLGAHAFRRGVLHRGHERARADAVCHRAALQLAELELLEPGPWIQRVLLHLEVGDELILPVVRRVEPVHVDLQAGEDAEKCQGTRQRPRTWRSTGRSRIGRCRPPRNLPPVGNYECFLPPRRRHRRPHPPLLPPWSRPRVAPYSTAAAAWRPSLPLSASPPSDAVTLSISSFCGYVSSHGNV